MRKTKMMLAVEKEHGDLMTFLPPLITEFGLSGAADALGLSKATLGYWLLKYQMRIERICLRPGERIEVTPLKRDTRGDGGERVNESR